MLYDITRNLIRMRKLVLLTKYLQQNKFFMSIRKAKKILKSEIDNIHKDRLRYKFVKWKKDRKVFLCETIWGSRKLIIF